MRIQRIQWAGILLESQGEVLMIDPVFNSFHSDFFGQALEELYELSSFKKPNLVVLTHLHSDHFDPVSIHKHFGENIRIIVPKLSVEEVKAAGFNQVTGLNIGECLKCGEFDIYAEYAVDGLGDPQVSYVIKANSQTFIHCGDTLWHGYWWKVVDKYGPIDVAFLPINAAIVKEKGILPSKQPICLGPEQAIDAAKILQCKVLIPIHYGTFNNPPIYNETKSPIERLLNCERDFEIKVLKNNEEFIFYP